MRYLLKQINAYVDQHFEKCDILIDNEKIVRVSSSVPDPCGAIPFSLNNKYIFPGFFDVHVHLREPGFFYKESIKSGTEAAVRGGYTSVCAMPNIKPVPDCYKNLKPELDKIKKDAVCNVYPYGSITENQKQIKLSNMKELAPYVLGFSDDGIGVQSIGMMKDAMKKAEKLKKTIVAHCEVDSLLSGGFVHDGEYSKKHGLVGISSESEYKEIERDIELVRQTHCKFHACHISTKESVDLIRQAKKEKLPVTCETAPHYILLCDLDIRDEGRFKMNPPIRSIEDKQAIIRGLLDGTIDMIATDHAPHSEEEKAGGLEKSLNGIVGLESAFPMLYTKLVKSGIMKLEKLIQLLQENPCNCFGMPRGIKEGQIADLTIFDLDKQFRIEGKKFASKGSSTPFEGELVNGECIMTIVGGDIVWQKDSIGK